MKCIAYATAEKYNIDDAVRFLRNSGFEPKFYDDVIHFSPFKEDNHQQDIFVFPYGCFVAWGVNEEFSRDIISKLEQFATNKYDHIFTEIINYNILNESKTHIVEEEDLIILEEDSELIKLSCSHALSQSAKLEAFEVKVLVTIENTRPLSKELSNNGKISLSRRELAKLIGSLFAERNSINLDNDILDMPEFFWRRPKYEPYYLMTSQYMDISTRMDILNRRLDAIHELYDILSNELNHLHSSRLEWVIITLIVIEVIMTLSKDLFKWI